MIQLLGLLAIIILVVLYWHILVFLVCVVLPLAGLLWFILVIIGAFTK